MDTQDEHPRLRIDRPRIRAAHEGRLAEWPRERRPLTIRAEVEVLENHRKSARIGAFVVESDEPPVVGGDGTAPTPLSFFISAVGFAVLTDLVRSFAVHDLEVDDLRLEIEADFPLGAKYGGEQIGVEASGVRYTVDVRSSAPREAVEAAIAWAERSCHAVHSLRQPVPVTGRYRLDGEPLVTTG
jgi:uncharacterized OsmC-like protein